MQLSRHMLAAWALSLCGLAAPAVDAAQPPTAAPTVAAPSGSIAGTVLNASDQAPLARARVVAITPSTEVPFVAITGGDGRYVIRNLPAGNYIVTVSRTGFASEAHARRRKATRQIPVGDGQAVTGIDVALNPAGVIAGRILDEDGAPLAGAVVAALESRFEEGQHTLAEIATATTDDRGEFRIIGLEPGQYYVSASDPAFSNVGSARGPIRYSATYYPGTSFADEARPLTVPAGRESPRAEFKLRIVPPSWISGRLVTSDAKRLLSGAVIVTPLDSDGSPVLSGETTLLPDGRFTFVAVPPGRYVIRARGETDPHGLALFAHFDLVVNGTDLENLQLTLRPGALLDGDVVFDTTDGTTPPPATTIRIRAPLADGSGFGDALTGTVQPNRHYSIRGLMDGEHRVVVEGLAAPWVVKSVVLRGTDITDEVIDAREGQQFRDVRVTLTDRAAEVVGHVMTARGVPAADAAVLVYPIFPQFWSRTNRRMRLARTDAAGQFSIYGLPPGQYLAAASYTFDEGDFSRRAFLEGLRAAATSFTVADPASHPTLALHLLSAVPTTR